MNRLFFSILIILVIAFSCTYDNEESLYPDSIPCDTTGITYNENIALLIEHKCFECHAISVADDNGGGLSLQDYKSVFKIRDIILSAIKHDGTAQEMPRNNPKLNDCQIMQFEIWIKEGGLEKPDSASRFTP